MGERKGQNHYYPPDYDPTKGGLNKFLGTHALRERANKLHLGILIIRFEMPYNIWCDGCGQHVGMGVRYNAEKSKVGMYYSTPVYQFKMKCTACDTHYVIKTDPGNLDYVIVSGARRQENRWDPTTNGQVVPDDKDTQRRLFDDPMFKLEHKDEDLGGAKRLTSTMSKLERLRDERWCDDYESNCRLRRAFREKKKVLRSEQEKDAGLLKRSSLDIPLLPLTEEDNRMAALLSLAPAVSCEARRAEKRDEIIRRPALPSCHRGNLTTFMGTKATKRLADRHTSLGVLVTKKRPSAESSPDVTIESDSTESPSQLETSSVCRDAPDTNEKHEPASIKQEPTDDTNEPGVSHVETHVKPSTSDKESSVAPSKPSLVCDYGTTSSEDSS